MKYQSKSAAAAVFLSVTAAFCAQNALAAPSEGCAISESVNANNHLILLSYPYTTPVKRVETYTESDDTGSAFYSVFNYDRCGQILDMHYQLVKNEQRFILDSEYGLTKMDDGWLNSYSVTMYNIFAKQRVLAFAREGTTRYRTDANGLIVGSIENYTAGSKEKIESGETRGSYLLDSTKRIANVTLLGSDGGDNRFFYNGSGMPFSFTSPNSHIIYLYDKQGRQDSSLEISVSSFYFGSKKSNCTEWNSHNDCTRAVSDEIELFPNYAVQRKSVFRSTFSYWDEESNQDARLVNKEK
ncbi:hypothetical protein SOASR030_08870 [Leminorella grimontii]|uniref:Lipoprotein n=1 Tax=Leminorella grimontii TaxID=82981 RepID=A0AAV5MYK3_9GAMM|nr:hypothetical protein [Leminorella grimontii]KFC96043.1 hypothetical protein GLGR_1217 [Leminorella grimontii ATCC 33999 = DSM 5078]GKX54775.1 hypothetical protein SOASR030_08870 [Leminorella grimontii]